MGGSLRIWRRVKVGRGMTVNLSRGGVSVTVGRVGRRLTLGKRGMAVSLGLPGTGIFYRWTLSWRALIARIRAWLSGPPGVDVEQDRAKKRPRRRSRRSTARR
ncbi:MAG: DUF4236 domain-containing protein [Anaerolineae bacterium]